MTCRRCSCQACRKVNAQERWGSLYADDEAISELKRLYFNDSTRFPQADLAEEWAKFKRLMAEFGPDYTLEVAMWVLTHGMLDSHRVGGNGNQPYALFGYLTTMHPIIGPIMAREKAVKARAERERAAEEAREARERAEIQASEDKFQHFCRVFVTEDERLRAIAWVRNSKPEIFGDIMPGSPLEKRTAVSFWDPADARFASGALFDAPQTPAAALEHRVKSNGQGIAAADAGSAPGASSGGRLESVNAIISGLSLGISEGRGATAKASDN